MDLISQMLYIDKDIYTIQKIKNNFVYLENYNNNETEKIHFKYLQEILEMIENKHIRKYFCEIYPEFFI